MKKLVSLLLALLMLGTMVACTGDDMPDTTKDTTGDVLEGGEETEKDTADETVMEEVVDGVKDGRFARPITATTIYEVRQEEWLPYSNADCLLIGTLQGLTTKHSTEQILLSDNGNRSYLRYMLEKLGATWNETVDGKQPTLENLLSYYADKDVYKGYILCTEQNRESVYVAVSVAGLLDGVVVTEENKHKLDDLGFTCLLDVSDKDDAWLRASEYWDQLSKDVAVERCYADYVVGHRGVPALIDFAVLNGAYYTLYEGYVEAEHSAHFEYLNDGAFLFGWYIPIGEGPLVASLGMINASIIPSDNLRNLSVLSGFPIESIEQDRYCDASVDAENVHTVTFIYSDGDNMWWHVQGGFTAGDAWFNYGKECGEDGLFRYNPTREYDIGWGVPATSIDLMGPTLSYLYEIKTDHDEFIMSLNGTGYSYVSRWDEKARNEMTEELADYMDRTDLRYMVMLDDSGWNEEFLSDYTEHDAIEGIFYVGSDNQNGNVLWTNGKPTVGCRSGFTGGYDGGYNEILRWISRDTLSVNPKKSRSYSMYYMGAWCTYQNVLNDFVAALPDNVEVVTPSEFMDRMVANCKPDDQ